MNNIRWLSETNRKKIDYDCRFNRKNEFQEKYDKRYIFLSADQFVGIQFSQ